MIAKILAGQTTPVRQEHSETTVLQKPPPAIAAAAASRFAAIMAGSISDDSSDMEEHVGEMVVVEGDFSGGGGSGPLRMPARAAAALPPTMVRAAPSTTRFATAIMGAVSSSSEGDSDDSATVRVPAPVDGGIGQEAARREDGKVYIEGPHSMEGTSTDPSEKKRLQECESGDIRAPFYSPPVYATSFCRLLGEGWRFGVSMSKASPVEHHAAHPSSGAEHSLVETRGHVVGSNTKTEEDAAVHDILYNAFASQAARAASKRMPSRSTVSALHGDPASGGGSKHQGKVVGALSSASSARDSPAGASNDAKIVADVMVRALQQLVAPGGNGGVAQPQPLWPVVSTYTDNTRAAYDRAGPYHGRVEPVPWNGGKDTISGFNESGYYGHFAGDTGTHTRTRSDWRRLYSLPQGYPHRNRSSERSRTKETRSRSAPRAGPSRREQLTDDSDISASGHATVRRGQREQRRRGRSEDAMSRRHGSLMDKVRQDLQESEAAARLMAAGKFPDGQAINSCGDTSLDDSDDVYNVSLDQVDDFMRASSAATSAYALRREDGGHMSRREDRHSPPDTVERWHEDPDYGTLSSTHQHSKNTLSSRDHKVAGKAQARMAAHREQSVAGHRRNAYDRSSKAGRERAPTTASLLPTPLLSGVLPNAATAGAMHWDVNSLLGDSDTNTSTHGAPTRNASAALEFSDSDISYLHRPLDARPLPTPLLSKFLAAAAAPGIGVSSSSLPSKRNPTRFINVASAAAHGEYSRTLPGADLKYTEAGDNSFLSETSRTSNSLVTLDDDDYNEASGDDEGTLESLCDREVMTGTRKGAKSASSAGAGYVDLEYTQYGPTRSDYEPSTPTLSPESSLDRSSQSQVLHNESNEPDRGDSEGSRSSGILESTADYQTVSDGDVLSSSDFIGGSSAYDDQSTDDVESSFDSSGGIDGVLSSIAAANRTKIHVNRSKLTLWKPNK